MGAHHIFKQQDHAQLRLIANKLLLDFCKLVLCSHKLGACATTSFLALRDPDRNETL